jgi:hypothetical protein
MVSGIVRPPALDLANRDLVEAHLHAVWLAESGKELAYEIPRVLELPDPALPVQKDIADVFAAGAGGPFGAIHAPHPGQHRRRAHARGGALGG